MMTPEPVPVERRGPRPKGNARRSSALTDFVLRTVTTAGSMASATLLKAFSRSVRYDSAVSDFDVPTVSCAQTGPASILPANSPAKLHTMMPRDRRLPLADILRAVTGNTFPIYSDLLCLLLCHYDSIL